MASQFPSSLFLPFQESSSELAQYTRLFRAFQQAIINGDLTPGAKLPASRALCAELGISRNTVKTAYEMLHAEGYVETRHGAGSFVATNLPLDTVDQSEDQAQPQAQVPPKLSAMAQTLVGVRKPNQMKTGELLLPAQPCVNSFPWSQWQRAVASAGRQMKYQQNSVMGNSQLREQIANYLRVVRGVKCTTDQVMICSGSQQAMFLALKLLVDAGEAVIAEDPGYQGIDGAIAAVGATKIPAQVDKQGIQLEDGLQQAPNARVVMLTPSRNHPLGHTLSL
ncbi:PLP-dependent aminotransferase family protein, partial [Pontibacterium sp.]